MDGRAMALRTAIGGEMRYVRHEDESKDCY